AAPAKLQAPVSASHASSQASASGVCAKCIRANMEYLASDALRGRGSGTDDERKAAAYVGEQLKKYGVEPAGDDGTYIQKATILHEKLKAPLILHYMTPGDGIPAQTINWTHGLEMLALRIGASDFRGPLKRVDTDHADATPGGKAGAKETPGHGQALAGAVVLLLGNDRRKIQEASLDAMDAGAVAVLVPASSELLKRWEQQRNELPELPARISGRPAGFGAGTLSVFSVKPEALAKLTTMPDGIMFYFEGTLGASERSYTWNAVGKLTGSDPGLRKDAIVLGAHLDHLGVGKPVNGDSIYNGADDDASGTVCVMELARALAAGKKPRRTVIFALFGGEELGGYGSTWFEEHPPVPLTDIVVDLEFEMIGRADPMYPSDFLWLSGWQRSDLGPTLAGHGAKLMADKRADQHFFERSDNYVLAKQGIVAQTASSFGLHADYHQPSDDIAHIDFKHMTEAIGSLIGPIEWLANSDFKPVWTAGGKP
ncbi:MAG TPA: M28 family peptidase, partial [Terriglobales bacterium]|nr:M28 family peptidase [Terriglobales bacterium]